MIGLLILPFWARNLFLPNHPMIFNNSQMMNASGIMIIMPIGINERERERERERESRW